MHKNYPARPGFGLPITQFYVLGTTKHIQYKITKYFPHASYNCAYLKQNL